MERFMPAYGRGYSADFFRNGVAPEEKRPPEECERLALALLPMQTWEGIYTGECGLCRGTIFSALYFPLGNVNRGGGEFER